MRAITPRIASCLGCLLVLAVGVSQAGETTRCPALETSPVGDVTGIRPVGLDLGQTNAIYLFFDACGRTDVPKRPNSLPFDEHALFFKLPPTFSGCVYLVIARTAMAAFGPDDQRDHLAMLDDSKGATPFAGEQDAVPMQQARLHRTGGVVKSCSLAFHNGLIH